MWRKLEECGSIRSSLRGEISAGRSEPDAQGAWFKLVRFQSQVITRAIPNQDR